MSDLIDFENPAPKPQLALPLPLIPAPEAESPSEPLTEPLRRSLGDNNPFDMVLKRTVDFEKNQEDPFERVAQKAIMGSSAAPKCEVDFNPREEVDISIITDLDNTNLLEDGRHVQASGSCNNVAIVPNINVSLVNCNGDLSILDASALNDSLVDSGSSAKNEDLDVKFYTRSRFASDNMIVPASAHSSQNIRRSLSVTDGSIRSNGQESSLASALFEDPLNNAFRSLSTNSSCSYLSNKFDISVSKLKHERLNSDSSVFSGVSNISAISNDPFNKISCDKLCSDNSVFCSTSNLSAIPSNVSSNDSKVFSNDTINRGFINSRLTLNSSSSVAKTPIKSADKSDLIKKFYEIKNRMSTNQIELPKDCKEKEFVMEKKETENNSYDKTVNMDNSCTQSETNTDVSDVISLEASRMAQMIEKMPLSKESTSNEDDLLLSKTQFDFEVLSDDESVGNLIDLPTSPIQCTSVPQNQVAEENKSENSIISPNLVTEALESESVQRENSDKKSAAKLLSELNKFIKVDNNPNAFKILNDLQKLMGIEYENTTEIQQEHTSPQNSIVSSSQDNKRSKTDVKENVPNNAESSESKETDNKSSSFSSRDNSENDHSDLDNADSGINDVNDSNDKPTDDVSDDIQKENQLLETKVNADESSEDQKLTMDLLETLNKIVNQKSENSAVNVLLNLGAVLNMAAELRSKVKDKESKCQESEKNIPNRLNRSASFVINPSPKKYPQNKSLEILPGRPSSMRRSVSTNPIPSIRNLDVKDENKFHLLNIKKQFPNDPGFAKSDIGKKKSPTKVASQSSLTGKPTINPIMSRFKKKPNTEVVAKKGPLKAVIPLGSMQKRASMSQKTSVSGNVTPRRQADSVPKLHIVSSTPNTNAVSKDAKSKPTAASTPNTESKSLGTKSRKTMSSVPLSTSLRANNSGLKSSPKKNRKSEIISPQKRPHMNIESTSSSPQWPRASPRSVAVRNHSLNELKTSKSPSSKALVRASSERKLQRHSVISPLRNSNSLTNKFKPTSRLSKRESMHNDSDKENYP